ncbi:MAG: SIS domain-containing protein [Phycisphaeraceae bacterium]|nr:MAG: SIS domain-containing protein [Phycisphaeraceae bacterium]
MGNDFRGIAGELDDARIALERFSTPATAAALERIADALAERLLGGGKMLACGNGGSAADAMHFCEELTGRYRDDRPSIAAIACIDPGHITCTANDYGYEYVFSRWVEGLGRQGDALIVMSTSGNSRNMLRAIEAARVRGVLTVGLLGKGGGVMRGLCDLEIVAPGETADRVQELHMLALHTLVGGIERRLLASAGALS